MDNFVPNGNRRDGTSELEDNFKKNYDTFTFELAPAFRYSDTGVIYGHFETGYSTPPGYALLVRGIDSERLKQAIAQFPLNVSQDALATDNLFTLKENPLEQET